MMLTQSNQLQVGGRSPHPRRLPAHLSVSLRHDTMPTGSSSGEIVQTGSTNATKTSPDRQDSEESRPSAESNVENWFDHSNNRPGSGHAPQFEDSKCLN